MSRRPRDHYGDKYLPNPSDPRDVRHYGCTTNPSSHSYTNEDYQWPSHKTFNELQPHRDGHRPRLPSHRQAELWPIQPGWFTPDQITEMNDQNSRNARRPATGFEPYGIRAGDSTKQAPRINDNFGKGKREHKTWSRSEERDLLEYVRSGKGWGYIAEKLGRTVDSVTCRWHKYVSDWPEARGVEYNPTMNRRGSPRD